MKESLVEEQGGMSAQTTEEKDLGDRRGSEELTSRDAAGANRDTRCLSLLLSLSPGAKTNRIPFPLRFY